MSTFSFIKLINTDSIRKVQREKNFFEQYFLFHLDIFNFLLPFCTGNYIHYEQKQHTFRLLIKYSLLFKIFIEEIKKYSKFFISNTMFIYFYLFIYSCFVFFFFSWFQHFYVGRPDLVYRKQGCIP